MKWTRGDSQMRGITQLTIKLMQMVPIVESLHVHIWVMICDCCNNHCIAYQIMFMFISPWPCLIIWYVAVELNTGSTEYQYQKYCYCSITDYIIC